MSAGRFASVSSVALREQVELKSNVLRYFVLAVFVFLMVALAFPLASLGRWMLGNEYYQQWPLLVVAGVALAIYRWRKVPMPIFPVFTFRVLIWTSLAVAMTATVFILPSRWMASLASLALIVAVVNYVGGRKLAFLMFGPVVLIAAAIPFPVGFDNWFVVKLQNYATWLASIWLDLSGVLHFTTGVSIQTGSKDYYVKDACSGIHSVFAAISVGVGYGVIRHYRLLRILVFLAQLLFWVVAANGIRVFLTIYGQTRWNLDLSGDAYHELLGMCTFGCGVLLAISGDCVIRYFNPAGSRPVDDWSIELELVRHSRWLDFPIAPKVAAGIVGTGAVAGLILSLVFFSYRNPSGTMAPLSEIVDKALFDVRTVEQSLFPEEIDGWKRVAHNREERGDDSVFGGMVSNVWAYVHPSGRRVLISLDGPYRGWHDLSVCYQGTGWDVLNMATIQPEDALPSSAATACELWLKRPPIDNAQVLYACIDSDQNFIRPVNYFGVAFMQFARRFSLGAQDAENIKGGVIQVQLLDERPGAISEKDKSENEKFFWKVIREVILRNTSA